MLKLLKKKNLHNENEVCSENELIRKEIRNVCLELQKTENWFQMEIDSNLIEACIHQREVLNARYKYLMNKLKPMEIS